MPDPDHIDTWLRIDDTTTTSAQPSEADLAAIAALGVRHVVNLGLHTHRKALPDEAGTVEALSMSYVHMPVDFQNPTEADVQAFYNVMQRLKGEPVHVHCIANFRVSAFFYRYRTDVLGWTPQDARADLDRIWRPEGVWAALTKL